MGNWLHFYSEMWQEEIKLIPIQSQRSNIEQGMKKKSISTLLMSLYLE